jgi:hypothetical protein
MTPRRFPPPWVDEELDACFVVRDHNGQQLAYVYFEDEPGRRSVAKLLTRDEARVAVKKPRPNRTLALSRPCTEVVSALIPNVPGARMGGRTQSRRLLTSPTALLSLSLFRSHDSTLAAWVPIKRPCRCVSVPAPVWG